MEAKQGRRELLEVIAQQKEQLARYETRLKDVVRAYKGLAKEKETLETSLRAITAAVNEEKEEEAEQARTDTEDCETDTESIAESVASDVTSASGSVQGAKPKARLAALSNSLAAVAAEKAQSEAKFLADKRKMRKDIEDLKAQLEEVSVKESDTKTTAEETKSKLIIERHERDKEMNNNKLMVQELQKLVTDERLEKEKLSFEVANLKSKIILLEDPSKSKQAEAQIRKLKEELEHARMQLVVKDKQIRDQGVTEERLGDIRGEMSELKRRHMEQLKSAESARESAELRALESRSAQEKRVVNLETRLQELSDSVCSYEKLRVQDKVTLASLQDELERLHTEKQELVRAASAEPLAEEDIAIGEDQKNFKKIVEKVLQYKRLLLEAEESEISNLHEVFMMPDQIDFKEKCKLLEDKLELLNRERSKVSPGKLDEFIANSSHQDKIKSLQSYNEDLKTKVSILKQKNYDLENDLKDKHLALLEHKQDHEKEKDTLRIEGKKQLAALRLDFQEHRERSLTLLTEKDEEIHKLRNQIELALEESFYSPERNIREKSKSPHQQALPRKISMDTIEFNSGQQESSSGPPLHYLQEIARKDVDIKELRQQQYQAETSLRELQLNFSVKEERYQDRIEDLEDTVRRLERMTTGEGASQEYLKNVVLNYMLSTDMSSKNHMLKAIAAVLRLTPKEVKRVIDHNKAWWWNQSKVPSSSPGSKL